jgi:hypothetical protein
MSFPPPAPRSRGRGGARCPLLEFRRMPKRCPDKQQNQEEPPLSLGPPQPAPVDDEAFARRAGEIIGNSNTSRHKASDAGGNKRFRSRPGTI